VPQCEVTDTSRPDLAFHAAERSPAVTIPPAAPAPVEGWRQHRHDDARSGAVQAPPADSAPGHLWRATLPTPIRASASVVEGHVLVGGHATGLVTSLDEDTGALEWQVRVPNWVHQEPVSDGRTVLVGFGDNRRSFVGRAPSGVAALDLETGARRWTAFDESSVMTSPIVVDTTLVYVTAAGVLKVRSLASGALLHSDTLPGGSIMGPPVAHGDTVVTTLDIDMVCAHEVPTARKLWCRELPWLRMVGHASASIADGAVFLSGVATARTISVSDLDDIRPGLLPYLLRSVLFPDYWELVHAGQVYLSLDLATGEVRWRGPLFAMRRVVEGHTAGTPVIADGVGVVVLPIADALVAFDLESGEPLWSSSAHQARGPALVVGSVVVLAGRDGVLEVRGLRDGQLRCSLQRPVGWDRAGPAAGRTSAIIADLRGTVESVPFADLLACRVPRTPA
jgi:outer membrane protein assembly factor BamB